jgi:DNA-binding NarL/FixJ family response regulator
MRPGHEELLEAVRQPARRVLVVDDHPSFRRCAHRLLTQEGFEVVGEAEDGVTAVSLASELALDFVVLDIQLPDVDGFEVASRLLEHEPGWRIVLVSSRDRAEYGARIDASGARGFVARADFSRTALERLLE